MATRCRSTCSSASPSTLRPLTLRTRFPNVYALGDCTSVGTPKAGVFSEGQAKVAADRIIAGFTGAEESAVYDGTGICYLEFGHDEVAKVQVTFVSGRPPTGRFDEPSTVHSADKAEFGSSRVQRWFGQDWTNR